MEGGKRSTKQSGRNLGREPPLLALAMPHLLSLATPAAGDPLLALAPAVAPPLALALAALAAHYHLAVDQTKSDALKLRAEINKTETDDDCQRMQWYQAES